MNKLSLVLSLAAVAAVSGCLDPQYKSKRTTTQEPTVVKPAVPSEPVEPVTPVDITTAPAPVVNIDVVDKPDPKSVEVKPVVKDPEFTTYIIQRGDTLSKISKRYNIKIEAIKANNPQIKKDIVRLGQKIKLPGKVDVGDQKIPEGAFASVPTKKPSSDAIVRKDPAPAKKAYTGATKEYIVKNGDTLGGIAIASGLTVRQLKELNGLSKDMIRVGQKLKVPASKVEKPAKVAATANLQPKKLPETAKPVDAASSLVEPSLPEATEKPDQPAAGTEVNETPVVPAAATANNVKYTNYTVVDGDDLIGISIRENLSVAVIRELNNIPQDEDVKPGMVIKLPVPAL